MIAYEHSMNTVKRASRGVKSSAEGGSTCLYSGNRLQLSKLSKLLGHLGANLYLSNSKVK